MSTRKKYGLTVFFLVGLFSTLAYARYTLTGDEGNSEAGGVIEKVSKVKKVSPAFVPEKIRHNPSPPPPPPPRYQRWYIRDIRRGSHLQIWNIPILKIPILNIPMKIKRI